MQDGKNSNAERTNLSSGLSTELLRGYSRAVRVGDHLYISGTTAMKKNGEVVGVGDPYLQTRYIIQNIREVIRCAGFQFSDIVRTRLYVTDVSQWKQFAKAHREGFESVRPVSTIVEVKRLMDTRFMIEMECEAILGCKLIETLAITFPEDVNLMPEQNLT